MKSGEWKAWLVDPGRLSDNQEHTENDDRGPRGYEDRIFARKAKAKPAVRALTAEAERLLTLRESHRMNRIPEVPRQPAV